MGLRQDTNRREDTQRHGEVEEGDVAQEPLGRHRGVVLASDQGPYLLLAVGWSIKFEMFSKVI